jgi:GR25 family glycosyltransferase involved in LPS biosynthesis
LKNQKTNDSHRSDAGNVLTNINDVFPYKVCINLDRRADRWEQMRTKFDRHGLQAVHRFSALDGLRLTIPASWSSTVGAYGCLLSHLQVVCGARELRQPSILIFEDDVVFDAHLLQRFSAYVSQLPEDWDVLYFGGLHLDELIETSENVHRVRHTNSTYAYALHHTIFDAFIELNRNANTPVDVNFHVLQSQNACYCFVPHLAWVESDSSDVQERSKNHWYIQHSLALYGRQIDRLLNQTSLIIAYRNPSRNDGIERNLLFLTHFYLERLPGITAVIVEQGVERTISAAALPKECQYFLARDGGPFNKALCFNIGMSVSNPEHTLLIFSSSDIFLEEWDIRGNLTMCQRYDGVRGFRSLIDLTKADTLKLQASRASLTPWFNAKNYSKSHKSDAFGDYCVFNRRSIGSAGGWEEQHSAKGCPPLSVRAGQRLRMFDSPNDALRLHHD